MEDYDYAKDNSSAILSGIVNKIRKKRGLRWMSDYNDIVSQFRGNKPLGPGGKAIYNNDRLDNGYNYFTNSDWNAIVERYRELHRHPTSSNYRIAFSLEENKDFIHIQSKPMIPQPGEYEKEKREGIDDEITTTSSSNPLLTPSRPLGLSRPTITFAPLPTYASPFKPSTSAAPMEYSGMTPLKHTGSYSASAPSFEQMRPFYQYEGVSYAPSAPTIDADVTTRYPALHKMLSKPRKTAQPLSRTNFAVDEAGLVTQTRHRWDDTPIQWTGGTRKRRGDLMMQLFADEDVNATQNRELLTVSSAQNWLGRQPIHIQNQLEIRVENRGVHPDVIIYERGTTNPVYINGYSVKPHRSTDIHRAFYEDNPDKEKRIRDGFTMSDYKDIRRQLKPRTKSAFTFFAEFVRDTIANAYNAQINPTTGKKEIVISHDGRVVSGSLINTAIQKIAGEAWTMELKRPIMRQDPGFVAIEQEKYGGNYDMKTDPGMFVRKNERQITNAIKHQIASNPDIIKYLTSEDMKAKINHAFSIELQAAIARYGNGAYKKMK